MNKLDWDYFWPLNERMERAVVKAAKRQYPQYSWEIEGSCGAPIEEWELRGYKRNGETKIISLKSKEVIN